MEKHLPVLKGLGTIVNYRILVLLSPLVSSLKTTSLIVNVTCLCVAPSPLETVLQFIISGSSVDVCVETKEAVFIKLVLRDTNNNRHVVECTI